MASSSKYSRKRKTTASRHAATQSPAIPSISLRGSRRASSCSSDRWGVGVRQPEECRQRPARCPTLRPHEYSGGPMAAVPVTAEIARRAAVLAWNDLPEDLVERTKQCLLDWFAVTVPGAQEELTD